MPHGASAGELILQPCEYATEDGSYAADCGTLVVPETRADPGSTLIALPVTRIRARSEDPKEPVFFLTGGPGQSNLDFSTSVGERASRYVADRDLVLVGYRGIDGSVRLDCPEVESALKRSSDVLSDEVFRAYGDAHRSCADRLTKDGVEDYSFAFSFRLGASRTRNTDGKIPPADRKTRPNATWSPDNKMFFVTRTDSRGMKDLFLVDSLAPPRPRRGEYK